MSITLRGTILPPYQKDDLLERCANSFTLYNQGTSTAVLDGCLRLAPGTVFELGCNQDENLYHLKFKLTFDNGGDSSLTNALVIIENLKK